MSKVVSKTGVVKFFNDKKGFGFIIDDETGKDVFVHIVDVSGKIAERNLVTFEIAPTKKGDKAVNVKVV